MNQQLSSLQKESLVQQKNEKSQNLQIISSDDLVYETGQLLSGKYVDTSKQPSNFYQRDYYNEQLIDKKGQTNDTMYNLTIPEYNQQTIALESSSNLNTQHLESQMSAKNNKSSRSSINKQIITTDMRSRLKNKNNLKISQQQQIGGAISPIAINVKPKLTKLDSQQNESKKLTEDTEQYFDNARRLTSSKEIDYQQKSPINFQQTSREFNRISLSSIQNVKRQSNKVDSKDDTGKNYEINGGISPYNYTQEDNQRSTAFKRRENKNDTNISGTSKVFPDKIKGNQNKQMSVFSQQSIQTRNDEEQKNLTLKVPNLRLTQQTSNQGPSSFQNFNQSPPIQRILNAANQSNSQIRSQPLIQQNTQQKLGKLIQSKSSKGFFSFLSGFGFKGNNSNSNTPLSTTQINPSQNNQQFGFSAQQINQCGINQSNVNTNTIQNANGSIVNIPVQEINPGTNWNFVKKLAKVKKFIDSIKTSNLYQSFYKVKKSHLDLVSDKSDYTIVQEHDKQSSSNAFGGEVQVSTNKKIYQHSLYATFINSLDSLSQYIPLFLPHQPLLNWYKVVMLIITIITLVYVPLKGSFSLFIEYDSYEFYCLFLVPFLLFIFEIFIALNTAYYEEGDIQMNRLKIIQQYLKSTFVIDLVSTVSIYFLYVEQRIFFVCFVMIRLFKIAAYRREINEYFYIQQRSNTIYTLVNLIFTVIFVAHYFACGFNFIAVIEEEQYCAKSWVITLNIDQNNWVSRYINSIYFSFITMVTVGFGDIKPTTDAEKVFVTLVALISSLIFAYTVNTIGTVFQEIAQQEAEYKQLIYFYQIIKIIYQIKIYSNQKYSQI